MISRKACPIEVLTFLALSLFIGACSPSELPVPETTGGTFVGSKLEPLIAPGARLEKIATGFEFVEGPVWHPGGYLLFSDIPQSRIMKWDPNEGVSLFREPSNGANGLAMDSAQNLIACETGPPSRLSSTSPDGTVSILVDSYEGKSLNSPNDLTLTRDDTIYFTDPVFSGLHEARAQLGFKGAYRLNSQRGLALIAGDFEWPNGVAVSPDERTVYVNDSARMHVRAFDLSDGKFTNDRIFAELRPWGPDVKGVPDGMEVDSLGNLYVTGPGGIWVFNPDGERLGIILTPESPSNCAFGDDDMKTLYITGTVSLFRLRLTVAKAHSVIPD